MNNERNNESQDGREFEDGMGCSGLVPSLSEKREGRELDRLKEKNAVLKAELDGAQRTCAIKHSALEECSKFPLPEDLHFKVCAALDHHNAGARWHSPEEYAALQAKCEQMRQACQSALNWATGRAEYSDGKDSVTALAEDVAPQLERALADIPSTSLVPMKELEPILSNIQQMRWKWVSSYMNALVEDCVCRLESLAK